jgi:hypothetical protein
MRRISRAAACLAALACVLGLPATASADAGQKIVTQCVQQGTVSTNWPQSAYTQALRDLTADAIEYTSCQQQIRAAQLAAAAAGGGRGAGPALGGAPSVSPKSFTPTERAAIAALSSPQTGGALGGQPRVGSEHAADAVAGAARRPRRRRAARRLAPAAKPCR